LKLSWKIKELAVTSTEKDTIKGIKVENVLAENKYGMKNITEGNVKNLSALLSGLLQTTLDAVQYRMNVIESDLARPMLEFRFVAVDGLGIRSLNFRFIDMSHRARLVTGFYDTSFPHPHNALANAILSSSAPYGCYGNVMYLASRQANQIHSANVQHPGVMLRIHEYFKFNLQLIVKPRKEERDIVIGDGGSLRQLDLQLVDKWFQPVVLLNPMIVTIKMRPIMEEQVSYG
jgi:hypothetical protein